MTVKLDITIFTQHLDFWKQFVPMDEMQRMVMWTSIRNQAYREIGLDYDWDKHPETLVIPPDKPAPDQPGVLIESTTGNYL